MMKKPPFYLRQRVRFKDSAFKENTGTVIGYYPSTEYPWAVEVMHREKQGTYYAQYGFKSCEMVAAKRRGGAA